MRAIARFTNAKVIVAKNYTKLLPDGGDPDANDRDGHGTGTSVVAAGGAASTPYGPITGVAPKAYIGNYKVLDANGGTSDVIAKAIDDAVADGMDVLNISLGSYVTSYSDIAADEVGQAAIARATQAGVIVVVAAGNDGAGRRDYRRLCELAGRDHAWARSTTIARWATRSPSMASAPYAAFRGRRAGPRTGDQRHAVRCDAAWIPAALRARRCLRVPWPARSCWCCAALAPSPTS